MHIHYIAQYAEANDTRNLSFSPAGVTKMSYLIDVLHRIGCKTTVYSTCSTKSKRYFRKSERASDKNGATYIYSSTFVAESAAFRYIELLFHQIQLFLYLLLHVKRHNTVMVYHERFYSPSITLVHKIRHFKLIYEIEELYTVAGNRMQKEIDKEIRCFKMADAYVLATQMLNDVVNPQRKPYIIAHGSYRTERNRNEAFNDGRIHVVYAGTLDKTKGGAKSAAEAALFLGGRYHLHILGFGNRQQVVDIHNLVEDISSKTRCAITYDGCLTGEEYIRFLQRCQIGLSTQDPNAEYNNTSFPSKVLVYLANGLRVVSIRIKALEQSYVTDLLYYYDENTPEAIANAVKSADLDVRYDGIKRIHSLDNTFCNELKALLEGI